MRESTVVIANVRPGLLGTYGDGGNAIVLRERLHRRGIAAEVLQLDGTLPIPRGRVLQLDGTLPIPRGSDIVVFGGGEDDAQTTAAADDVLRTSFHAALDAGAVVLAVCAGFQLLGHTFQVGPGNEVPGFGVLDCRSDRMTTRAVGEIVGDVSIPGVGTITGFENHGGRTRLGPDARPLATLSVGVGNGSEDGAEGAVQGNIVATYLHGPVLARNPALADALLERVTGPLGALPGGLTDRLRRERLQAAAERGVSARRRSRLRGRLPSRRR